MSFKEAISSVLDHYADFNGRARRSEYWYFILATFIANAVLSRLAKVGFLFKALYIIYTIAILLPSLAVLWRRLHDVGRSGAYAFMILIPVVGAILLIIRLATDSQAGPNRFGPNPKENGDDIPFTY